MNAESKYELVKKLYDSTLENRIQWEKTSQRDAFQVSIKNYVVTVLLGGDEQDPDCLLRINNSDGDLVDEISWSHLKQCVTPEGKPGQVILYGLHEVARSNAMGADTAFKEITKELDGLTPF